MKQEDANNTKNLFFIGVSLKISIKLTYDLSVKLL